MEALKRGEHLQNLGLDGKIFECILGTEGEKVWTGFIWLKIAISGGLL
jgi:hypothetical protein